LQIIEGKFLTDIFLCCHTNCIEGLKIDNRKKDWYVVVAAIVQHSCQKLNILNGVMLEELTVWPLLAA